ncbi:MAG: hypothetical protein ACT4P7_09555 [Gemmatimonadaceae bacterium]
MLSTACYVYAPVRTAAPAGAHLAVEVNDEGRAALTRALGPGVLRFEGRLVSQENGGYVLDATSVTQGRSTLPVDGIRVAVSPAQLTRVDERRLSRKRTWMTVGAAALAVAGFFFTSGFFGRQTPPDEPGTPPGPDQSRW